MIHNFKSSLKAEENKLFTEVAGDVFVQQLFCETDMFTTS